MRPIRVVGLYLIFVLVGGALLAPWVYALVQALAGSLPILQPIADKPFPRFVNRTFLVLAVLGLRPFLRAAGFTSWRSLGLAPRPETVKYVAWGFAIGLASLACVVVLAVAAGAREFAAGLTAGAVLKQVFKAALTAVLVSSLEELIFRGALFGSLRKSLHWPVALVLSSALFALLHFLERAGPIDRVHWSSGLVVLGEMLGGLGKWSKLVPGFFNLTLVGIILGLAYQRTGSLHLSIGLHAGWIFWLKLYGFLTDSTAASRAWFFGTNKLIDGWLAFVVLAVVLAALSRCIVQERPPVQWRERPLLS